MWSGSAYTSFAMVGLLFDAAERAQLCDLLDELGPDAPTLLEPWMTRDLAAHLALRDLDRLAGPGLVLPVGGAASPNGEDERSHARITGPPGELLLYLFGRQGAAHVELDGPPAAVEAVRRARFGI